jgi:hypothetical protein
MIPQAEENIVSSLSLFGVWAWDFYLKDALRGRSSFLGYQYQQADDWPDLSTIVYSTTDGIGGQLR